VFEDKGGEPRENPKVKRKQRKKKFPPRKKGEKLGQTTYFVRERAKMWNPQAVVNVGVDLKVLFSPKTQAFCLVSGVNKKNHAL